MAKPDIKTVTHKSATEMPGKTRLEKFDGTNLLDPISQSTEQYVTDPETTFLEQETAQEQGTE